MRQLVLILTFCIGTEDGVLDEVFVCLYGIGACRITRSKITFGTERRRESIYKMGEDYFFVVHLCAVL